MNDTHSPYTLTLIYLCPTRGFITQPIHFPTLMLALIMATVNLPAFFEANPEYTKKSLTLTKNF